MGNGWEAIIKTLYGTPVDIHILPINDIAEHTFHNCTCNPSIEENGKLIIHNAFDGRKDFEDIENLEIN